MAEWLGARENWTRHPRPLARAALKEAADAGWSFRKLNGHSFGMLRCGDTAEACKVVVYSTSGPADGSETAREIRKGLQSCVHRGQPDASPDDSLAGEEIEARVERLIAAVEALDKRAQELEQGDQALDLDDLPGYEAHVARLTDAENEAQMSLVSLGLPVPPWPPDIGRGELLREATTLADQIREDAARLRTQARLDQVR